MSVTNSNERREEEMAREVARWR